LKGMGLFFQESKNWLQDCQVQRIHTRESDEFMSHAYTFERYQRIMIGKKNENKCRKREDYQGR
jgi:hypothetical protein